MLKRESWRHYDPQRVQACQRRGHLWIHQGDVKSMGKIWPCPEHSARGLAYQGPEKHRIQNLSGFLGLKEYFFQVILHDWNIVKLFFSW